MVYDAASFDVAVIGAGHAGIEAALAAARLGCHTAVFTINLDAVGNCPCNPCIGGTAKGHLVREIDALGGEMGKTADACTIQSRMLNGARGRPSIPCGRRSTAGTICPAYEAPAGNHSQSGSPAGGDRFPGAGTKANGC